MCKNVCVRTSCVCENGVCVHVYVCVQMSTVQSELTMLVLQGDCRKKIKELLAFPFTDAFSETITSTTFT